MNFERGLIWLAEGLIPTGLHRLVFINVEGTRTRGSVHEDENSGMNSNSAREVHAPTRESSKNLWTIFILLTHMCSLFLSMVISYLCYQHVSVKYDD